MVLLEQIWFPLLAQPADDPFPLEQLRQTTENAYRHAKNGAGAHAASDPVEAFGDVIGSVDNIPNVSKFKLRTREDRKNQKPLDWLVPGVLLDKNVVFLYGRWGSFKSYLALDLGLSVSTGTPWCGVMPKTGPVIYACGEGMVPLETSRAPAWEHAKGVEAPGFYTCPAPLVVLPDEAKDFCTEIAKVCENPALIIIDTLAKSALGLDLNSSVDAGKIAAFCKLIQERFNCCVMVVHHSGKDSERGMLGSILLPSNADSVLEVIRPKDKCPAVELWVRKFKDAPEPEEAFRFEMEPHLTDIVPKQITPERLRELTSDEDELKPAVVGKALRELGEPVTTHVLASALAPDAQGGDVEARQKAVRQFERRLKKAASGVLAAYVTDGIWSVPS
jgi:hypothetical protein